MICEVRVSIQAYEVLWDGGSLFGQGRSPAIRGTRVPRKWDSPKGSKMQWFGGGKLLRRVLPVSFVEVGHTVELAYFQVLPPSGYAQASCRGQTFGLGSAHLWSRDG